MWNFAGRQNDLQGDGGLLRGGAATGIPFVDSFFYGDSDTHPEDMTGNKGHNVYYALPLILGLIGLFFQIGRGRRGVESFWVTFMLFFMTGIAIVLYLNQYPGQPRERDYAYVGSFYAFAIWVGFGVAAIATTASRYLSKQPAKKTSDEDAPVTISTAAAGVASLVLLLIPIQMAGQNWDDHDRSGRTVASDMGRNYLESCEPNAILFCYGDNDTFPLWYAQEVEGIRTDVRTVNLSYLSGDWYIDQMKKQAYEGKPLPIGLLPKSYYYYNNYALVSPNGGERQSVEEAYKALQGHGPGSPAMLPSPDLYVAVDSAAVAQRIAKSFPALTGHITPDFSLSLHGRQFLDIGGLSVLDLIAGNKWERPIYWAITSPRNAFNGMTASMVQTGMASQLLPLAPRVDSTGRAIDYGIGNLDRMYETVMTKFRWCGADRPGTYFDENARGIVSTLRNQIFTPLANGYLERGDKQKAQAILKKCLSVILEENVPYETSALYFADALYRADMRAEADHVLQAIARRALSTLTWAVQLPAEKLEEVSRHGELQEAYTAISYALDFAKDYNSQALSRYEQEIAALLRRLGVAQ
jgi:putative membrane protein